MESKIIKDNLLQHREEFETVYGIISAHKKRAMNAMHNESLNMLWEVGAYVSDRLKKAVWGDGVVRMLAEYIHTRSPKAKGWSYRTIYKMVQFYETYSSQGFNEIVHHYGMQHYLSNTDQREFPDEKKTIVPFEMAQIVNDVHKRDAVPFVLLLCYGVEFDPLLAEAGSNAFTMSPTRWVELTSAIGIITKNGAGGGTYAQRDIAFKFANWVSVEFVHKRSLLCYSEFRTQRYNFFLYFLR